MSALYKKFLIVITVFFISALFTFLSATQVHARPDRPTFTVEGPTGESFTSGSSRAYLVNKGERIKVTVSNFDFSDGDSNNWEYKVVIGKNDNRENNQLYGRYEYIRLNRAPDRCTATANFSSSAFQDSSCSGTTFTTYINTSQLNEVENTEYFIRLEDSDGSDESNPVKIKLFEQSMYYTTSSNFFTKTDSDNPRNPLGTNLYLVAFGFPSASSPYTLSISANGQRFSSVTINADPSQNNCVVTKNTPEPQPFQGIGNNTLNDGTDYACISLDDNRNSWRLNFRVETDSDSLNYDLSVPEYSYTVTFSGNGLNFSRTFTVTNQNTKYAVIPDSVADTITCKTSSDSSKRLFDTKEECDENALLWKWYLIEDDYVVSDGRGFGVPYSAIQQVFCQAYDSSDPENANIVENSQAFDTYTECDTQREDTPYTYILSDELDLVRGCHQDLTGEATPSFGSFEECRQDLCENLQDADSSDFETHCGSFGEIELPPPPPPPCADENIGSEGCTTVNTAIGQISVRPTQFVTAILGILLSISGGIAVLIISFSGYKLMTSNGNPEAVQEARERLTSAIVGLLFIIFSLVIIQVIGVDVLRIPGFGS